MLQNSKRTGIILLVAGAIALVLYAFAQTSVSQSLQSAGGPDRPAAAAMTGAHEGEFTPDSDRYADGFTAGRRPHHHFDGERSASGDVDGSTDAPAFAAEREGRGGHESFSLGAGLVGMGKNLGVMALIIAAVVAIRKVLSMLAPGRKPGQSPTAIG